MTITSAQVVKNAVGQTYAGMERTLTKGAVFLKEKDLEESVALNWRLAPDMFPMNRQIQIATELPARSLSRLAGAELPEFGAAPESFEGAFANIKKARDVIMALSNDALEADPEGTIALPTPRGERTFPRAVFLQNFVLPNIFFHVTATYLNLRNIGVDVGKMDFLAAPEG